MERYFPGERSAALFERAKKVIPGGVNSPVRSFKHVGGDPIFFSRGEGPYVYDADGKRYLDFVGSWGPLIFGHAPKFVTEIISKIAANGTSFGAPTEVEVSFAEKIKQLIPSMEMVRCVSSGTEATMSAIRLARGYTGRKRIIKFTGCYHGHGDSLLVKAGSGVAALGIPESPGVPDELAALTTSIQFNDLELFQKTISSLGPEKIACVIAEPVAGNMNLVLPVKGYLEGLRELCAKHGIILIFDEVMTGFRVALGGAQGRFNVTPDLTTLGKVVGGGLPVGVFGGKQEIMRQLAPLGPVYQAGTLSGNPLALSVGLEMLRRLEQENPYPLLEEYSQKFCEGLISAGKEAGIPISAAQCGSMVGFFFSPSLPENYEEAAAADIERFRKFFHEMLKEGIYLAPSAFEAGFLSTAHTAEHIEQFVSAARRTLKRI